LTVRFIAFMSTRGRKGWPGGIVFAAIADAAHAGSVENAADVVVHLLRDGTDQSDQVVSLSNRNDTGQVDGPTKGGMAATTTSSTHDCGCREISSSVAVRGVNEGKAIAKHWLLVMTEA